MDVVKRKVYEIVIYSWKKKVRVFTKIYAFYPFCENSKRLLSFDSFSQKNSFIDVQVGSKYFFE